jgi:hypothetical protein
MPALLEKLTLIVTYLVTGKVKERLSVSIRAAQNFDMERCNVKKLKDVEVNDTIGFEKF